MLKSYTLEEDLCLRKIYAKKCFYNSHAKTPIGDHILPLTDECYKETEGKAIFFIQGIEQNALRNWVFEKEHHTSGVEERNYKVWPAELIGGKVYAIQYDTKQLDP